MKSRAVTIVLLVVLGVATIGAIAAGLVPWYLSRPRPIPAAPPTVVPELTGPPFASAAPSPSR